ncbi:MAG: hypothetical protein ACR2PA_18570 [Hyphomicrobiaceae bacterium]
MKSLSLVELIAVVFAGIAGLASGVQAYVSWETRGEVSRAIVFAQRIDSCAKVMAALEPFVAKARPEGRAVVAAGQANGRYSLPAYYYRQSSGNAGFRAKHGPRVEKWRVASAGYQIISPKDSAKRLAFFDRLITREIEEGRFMSQADLISWLEQLETKTTELMQDCRSFL